MGREKRRSFRKRRISGGDKTLQRIEKAVDAAAIAARNTRTTGEPPGNPCLFVSIHAFKESRNRIGGLRQTQGISGKKVNLFRAIGEAGLDVSSVTPVLPKDADFSAQDILSRPREIMREMNPNQPTKKIVGFLGVRLESHSEGHTFGIIPRNALPRRVRKILGRKRHLLVDTEKREGIRVATNIEIADSLTQKRSNGYILALFKKTRG